MIWIFSSRQSRTRCEIPDVWRRSDVFIVNSEHIPHLVLVFLLVNAGRVSIRFLLVSPSPYSFVQSQQWNHQNNVINQFKCSNKNTRTTSLTLFWCLYCWLQRDFTGCFDVCIVDFKQVNAAWVVKILAIF